MIWTIEFKNMKSWATPTKLSYTQSLTTQKNFFPLPEIKYRHLPLAVGKKWINKIAADCFMLYVG